MGHVGLTPQSYVALGGYRAQGTSAKAAFQVVHEAEELADAGCFAVVLECLPNELTEQVTKRLKPRGVATIGIGAGTACSGQVLVCADLLGLSPHTPRFARQYLTLGPQIRDAFASYRQDVEAGTFPDEARMPKPMCTREQNELRRLLAVEEDKKATVQKMQSGVADVAEGAGGGLVDDELRKLLLAKQKEEALKNHVGGQAPAELIKNMEDANAAGAADDAKGEETGAGKRGSSSFMGFLGAAGGGCGGLLLSQRTALITKAEETETH